METARRDQFIGRASAPVYLEYAWYTSLAYATLGQAWGVEIPVLGGALLVLVAVACIASVGDRIVQTYEPARLALLAGVLIIGISYSAYSEQSFGGGIAFVGWLCTLVIVQTLTLRPGFLQRFAWAAFAIGVAALPLVTLRGGGATARAFGSGGVSNPNVLGMWFGFSAVYFLFEGLQSKNGTRRTISWGLAIGSLFIVFLTVSRGALAGVILACVVGFGSTLKRFIGPVLLLVGVLVGVYVSEVFDPLIEQYVARGAEESGRERLWPAALERIYASPWVGVGLDDIKIKYSKHKFVNPHNAFLHIALAGGIVPAICYLGYLVKVGVGCLHLMKRPDSTEALLLPPLVAFGVIQIMVADYNFMSAWVVVVLALTTVKRISGSPLSQ